MQALFLLFRSIHGNGLSAVPYCEQMIALRVRAVRLLKYRSKDLQQGAFNTNKNRIGALASRAKGQRVVWTTMRHQVQGSRHELDPRRDPPGQG